MLVELLNITLAKTIHQKQTNLSSKNILTVEVFDDCRLPAFEKPQELFRDEVILTNKEKVPNNINVVEYHTHNTLRKSGQVTPENTNSNSEKNTTNKSDLECLVQPDLTRLVQPKIITERFDQNNIPTMDVAKRVSTLKEENVLTEDSPRKTSACMVDIAHGTLDQKRKISSIDVLKPLAPTCPTTPRQNVLREASHNYQSLEVDTHNRNSVNIVEQNEQNEILLPIGQLENAVTRVSMLNLFVNNRHVKVFQKLF